MNKQELGRRFLVSLGVGLLVSVVAVVASWVAHGEEWHLRAAQDMTQGQIADIVKAIDAYRTKTGHLPSSLEQLRENPESDFGVGFAPDGTLRDHWGRPFLYAVNGDSYTVLSYGMDGKPGGRGLNCDLTNHNFREKGLYPAWYPTFWQYLFEMPTEKMTLACLICGFLAFLTSLASVRAPEINRKTLLPLVIKISILIAFATVVAVFMSALEIPSGH